MAPGASISATHALRPAPAGVPTSDLVSSPAVGGAGLRPHVTIRGLSKRFGDAVIYDKFDLDIPRGELISVFGPNGCGKSTLINMIAGAHSARRRPGAVRWDAAVGDEIRLRVPELPR